MVVGSAITAAAEANGHMIAAFRIRDVAVLHGHPATLNRKVTPQNWAIAYLVSRKGEDGLVVHSPAGETQFALFRFSYITAVYQLNRFGGEFSIVKYFFCRVIIAGGFVFFKLLK
ncbi:hypothetical protein CEXT_760051 [Caerostris extrusa]|uniref:Uncharacterized protein n=1 Tax=Caerostris extrusa TaxID=172846 RepID=A0AAV4NHX0_CAEEX|nr:hypothetical protein CEXT_760051 [Caerostris extrusa]